MNKPKVVIVLGPTASGKTELAVRLAQDFNGAIISTDSRQMYQEFNIGTGKIKGKQKVVNDEVVVEYEGINHYFINNLKSDQEYSLALFKKDVDRIIKKITAQGKLPIVAGGTGLYIQVITDNLNIPEVKPDWELRNNLEAKIKAGENKELENYLETNCPILFLQTDVINPRRLIRAYEICVKVGDVTKTKLFGDYDCLQLGIKVDREDLYQKINKRVDGMVAEGLVEEVRELLTKYGKDVQPMTGIGYRQIGQFLEGEISKEEAIELIKRDSRRYAKRQITWWQRDDRIVWLDDKGEAEKLVCDFINK